MLNKVILIGRLTREVEVRYTSKGTTYARFTLAVNRTFKSQDGKQEADFVSCTIWRKGAENLAKFTHKGSLIGIEGRLQTSTYDKNGQTVYQTDVLVDEFHLLEPKYKSNVTEAEALAAFGDAIEVSDDELPFD